MWILPKNIGPLLQWSSAQVMQVSISDSNEQSRICASSLLVRSKPSPLRTWSQKWKRDSWTQHLSGRILKPSLDSLFATKWTSLWEASHARASARPASASETRTLDISGLSSSNRSDSCSQVTVSSRMSMALSVPNSQEMAGETQSEHPFCSMSAGNWKDWVTAQRLEYSQRLKSARLTRESGSLSLQNEQAFPTPAARDCKNTSDNPKHNEARWAHTRGKTLPEFVKHGPQDRESLSSPGSRQEQRADDQWPTISSNATTGGHTGLAGGSGTRASLERMLGRPEALKLNAKLNPRWVETLMGLPIGWTMPSCTSPVTIELTSCASLETGLCLPQQRKHGEPCGEGSTASAWQTPTLNFDESYYQKQKDGSVTAGLAGQVIETDHYLPLGL